MKTTIKVLVASLIITIGLPASSADTEDSVLVQMFKWWNAAYRQEQDFTEAGFAQYFTDDIVFIINGERSPKGIKSLTERFNKIKATYHIIEIILPMREEFASGDKLFTYHVNRGKNKAGDPWGGYTHVMGYVVIKDGKIDLVNFLHLDEDGSPS